MNLKSLLLGIALFLSAAGIAVVNTGCNSATEEADHGHDEGGAEHADEGHDGEGHDGEGHDHADAGHDGDGHDHDG